MEGRLSGEKYLVKKGRKLPFNECFINKDWQEKGLATILICKKQPGGHFIFCRLPGGCLLSRS